MKRILIGVLLVAALGVAVGWHSTREKHGGRTGLPSGSRLDAQGVATRPSSGSDRLSPAVAAGGGSNPRQTPAFSETPSGSVMENRTDSSPGTAPFKLAVDRLVSPQSSFGQKQEAWRALRDSGKLDQAIAELEQRVSADPRSADGCAALGQAYLQKAGAIRDMREQGILAMKADQIFDTALENDPSNWEARFTKAMAMAHWPPQLGKGQEVVEHFTQLILQQEAQAPQPHFAQSYLWLGDQYQKLGQEENARAAWARGQVVFPADAEISKRLAQPASEADAKPENSRH